MQKGRGTHNMQTGLLRCSENHLCYPEVHLMRLQVSDGHLNLQEERQEQGGSVGSTPMMSLSLWHIQQSSVKKWDVMTSGGQTLLQI